MTRDSVLPVTDAPATDAPATESNPAPRRQARGTRRHDAIVRAAADVILRDGPAALTHRTVAAEAGVPLAATTYYFAGLDELVAEAGALLAAGWADHAAQRVDVARAAIAEDGIGAGAAGNRRRAELLTDAILPEGDRTATIGFYEHLVGAARSTALATAYAGGRAALDAALAQVLDVLGIALDEMLVVAVVDGAAVSALAEGRDVRAHAIDLIEQLLSAVEK